jgi:hypothetical protein
MLKVVVFDENQFHRQKISKASNHISSSFVHFHGCYLLSFVKTYSLVLVELSYSPQSPCRIITVDSPSLSCS